MSDEHKPHENDAHHAPDHAEPDHAEPVHADAHHAPAAAHADDHGHAAPEAHHDDHHAESSPAAEAHHDEPAHGQDHAPEAAHGHEAHHAEHEHEHAHDAASEAHHAADHGHDHHAEPPAYHEAEPAHAEPAPADHGHGAEALAAAAVVGAGAVGAAAASTSSERRPIWSDQGDAPFEDGPVTPVYARKGRKGRKSGGGSSTSAGSETAEIIKTVFFALLIALVLRTLVFQPFTIPSASMEPNLYEGDYIVVSKWSYGYSRHSIPFSPPVFNGRIMGSAPQRGDIAVFKLPRDNRTDYIKRVIGLPGDRVQMIANRLYINGQPVDDVVIGRAQVDDAFGSVTRVRETLPGGRRITIQDFGPGNDLDDTPVYEVPAGFYFMMGDNRDNSIDSRVNQANGVGLVPEENLVGKAQIILFSWEPGAAFLKPWTWFSHLRPSRFFTVLS